MTTDPGGFDAARWPVDTASGARALRVAFAPPPAADLEFWLQARAALAVWSERAGVPFLFDETDGHERAEVEFRWVDRFQTSQAGATHRRVDDRGLIRSVTVVLAREHSDGTRMSPQFRHLVALHEVGHVLGLPHSDNPGDVMHPGNRNMRISERDVRSLQFLYAEPGADTDGAIHP